MTDLIYQTDSYIKSFEATILESNDEGVVLDRSAFYPGGGGQPPDHGDLKTEDGRLHQVTGARRIDGKTVLVLAGSARPPVGAAVTGTLDWDRRYLLMRTHTALHMLSGVIWRDYAAKVTGGNMEPGKGRLDFELPEGSQELASEIEAKMAVEVAARRAISVQILAREEALKIPDLIRTKVSLLPAGIREIRTVNIEGLDLQADGGTHVANSGEVGKVTVAKYKSKGKGNKRLYIELAHDLGS